MSSSSKRSRLSQSSSSQGEVVTLMPTDSSSLSWPEKKRATEAATSVVEDAIKPLVSNKSIWTLDDDSPVAEVADQFGIHERIGDIWWQTCCLCKKAIHNEMNIYMYGFLQAFCSVECRDAKIAVDDIFGRSPQQTTPSAPRKAGRRPEVARYK